MPSRAAAQDAPGAAPAAPAPSGWLVRRDAFADLWYHGLALAGAPGYAPLPLHSPAYVAAVTAARRRAGVATRLDDARPALRAAFARDSALEVLHFVPLWFAGEEPLAVVAALRAASRAAGAAPDGGSPGVARAVARPDARLAPRAAAVVAALPAPGSRETLERFLDALDDDWHRWLRDDRAARGPDAAALAALQREWDDALAPALAGYLGAVRRARGTVLVVPALGADGRIGRDAAGATVVAVGTGDDARVAHAPLLAAVRELAYPLLDRLPADAIDAGAPDRLAALRRRESAAVQAGALLLDAVAPVRAAAYRQLYAAALAPGGSSSAFDPGFPLEPAAAAALRAAVSRHTTRARARTDGRAPR